MLDLQTTVLRRSCGIHRSIGIILIYPRNWFRTPRAPREEVKWGFGSISGPGDMLCHAYNYNGYPMYINLATDMTLWQFTVWNKVCTPKPAQKQYFQDKMLKIHFGENDITFSSEGVFPQMRVLINSTQLELQNKTGLRQKYFLSEKLRSIEYV